jgi:DnaJ-like protein
MDGSREFLGKQRIDPALTSDAALPGKRERDHLDMEVRFPLGPGACVAGMAVRFIADLEPQRLQFPGELVANALCDAHGEKSLKAPRRAVKMAMQPCAAALVRAWPAPHTQHMPRASIAASIGPAAAAAAARLCEHPGCSANGDYRAPRSRDRLRHFYWFCLDHVRAYNAQWNYYAGMSSAEIEAEIRNDTVWQRPTWPWGSRTGPHFDPKLRDFGLFGLEEDEERVAKKRPLSEQEQALAVFNLAPPVTFAGLKSRYKELVKAHHPDAHGGDRAAEERLKVINQAYTTLKASYFPSG